MNYKTIAEQIRKDFNNGERIEDDIFASEAYCYKYGGENGTYKYFKENHSEEAEMLEQMIED